MTVLLGILGAIVTILLLVKGLRELGFDPSSLNPFQWYRRHKWQQRYHAKPLYNLDNPLQAAALLMTATARCDGDMSASQKQTLLRLFEEKLQLPEKDAEGYLTSSVYLLRDEFDIAGQVNKILEPSKEKFSGEQAASLLELMQAVASADGSPRQSHHELIAAVKACLEGKTGPAQTWQT